MRRWLKGVIPDFLIGLSSDTPGKAAALLRNPVAFLLKLVVRKLIRPLFTSVARAGATVISAILLVFLGSDRSLGTEGQLGLADIPVAIATGIISAAEGPANAILGVVIDFNVALAGIASNAGIAAPPIVLGLFILEGGVLLFLAWSLIRTIDIPIINLGPLLKTLTSPVRGVVRLFTGGGSDD